MTLPASTLIGGASDRHARNASDFYATPAPVTRALAQRHPWLLDGLVWEPACGSGDMSEALLQSGAGLVYSSDLRHTGYGVGGVDFLKDKPITAAKIVTNPPFKLAAEFIARACSAPGVTGVAMLLKATYWNAASREKLFRDTRPTWVHPLTWRPNFAPDRGNAPTMDLLWTVWDKRPECNIRICRFDPLRRPR